MVGLIKSSLNLIKGTSENLQEFLLHRTFQVN